MEQISELAPKFWVSSEGHPRSCGKAAEAPGGLCADPVDWSGGLKQCRGPGCPLLMAVLGRSCFPLDCW